MCSPFPMYENTAAQSLAHYQRLRLQLDEIDARRHGYEPAPAFECKGCGFINRGMLVFCEQCKRPKD